MFAKIIIVVAFFSLGAEAQILNQIVKQIEISNQSQPGVVSPESTCANCGESAKFQHVQSCIQQLCDDRNLKSYDKIPEVTSEQLQMPALDEDKVTKAFDQLDAIVESADAPGVRDKMIQAIQDPKSLTSDDIKLTVQFMAFSLSAAAYKFNGETFKFEIDKDKFSKLKIPLNSQNTAVLSEMAAASLKDWPSYTEFTSASNPQQFLEQSYPGKTRLEAIQALVAEIKVESNKLKSSDFGKMIAKVTDEDVSMPKELIEDLESGKDVTDAAVQELIGARIGFKYMKAMADSSNLEPFLSRIDLEDFRSQMTKPELVQKTIDDLRTSSNDKVGEKINNRIGCVAAYRRNSLILPDQSQIKKLNELIDSTKKNLLDKWSHFYSVATRQKIQEYLAGVKFYLPPTKEEFRKSFQDRLKRKVLREQRTSAIAIKDVSTFANFYRMTSFISAVNPSTPSSKKDNMCTSDEMPQLNDANYTMMGKIQLSYTTAQSERMAQGVIAHELGHGISLIFKSGKASGHSKGIYDQQISCLSSLHETAGASQTEEDYADFTAGTATSENFACVLGSTPPTLFKDYLTSEDGIHARSFYRLLHMEMLQKGKVPDTCNQSMAELKAPTDFLKCQKQLKAEE